MDNFTDDKNTKINKRVPCEGTNIKKKKKKKRWFAHIALARGVKETGRLMTSVTSGINFGRSR